MKPWLILVLTLTASAALSFLFWQVGLGVFFLLGLLPLGLPWMRRHKRCPTCGAQGRGNYCSADGTALVPDG